MYKMYIFKSDDISNVRIQKYLKIFTKRRMVVEFIGWKRTDDVKKFNYSEKATYLLSGGGYGNKSKLLFRYILFLFRLQKFIFINNKKLKKSNILVINFDVALIFYFSSFFNKMDYIYEVHDSFALSYSMPKPFQKFVLWIDKKIMAKAKYVIHVDENRIVNKEHNNLLIQNSPLDFFKGEFLPRSYNHSFAVIGNISEGRGIQSIYKFAKENPDLKFLIVGKFYDDFLKKKILNLINIDHYEYIPQQQLFQLLLDVCGIFSLYDSSLEINRLAASNKVYDAMMLGIPVITNPEVVNSQFILENNFGVIVNYQYDKSWDILKQDKFVEKSKIYGKAGRTLYEKSFEFEKMVNEKLITQLL